MRVREDDETVVSISRQTETFMLSTTSRGLASRCWKEWGAGEVFDRGAGGKRWVWRDMPMDLIRLTPRSVAKAEAARQKAKAAYKGQLHKDSGGDVGSVGT